MVCVPVYLIRGEAGKDILEKGHDVARIAAKKPDARGLYMLFELRKDYECYLGTWLSLYYQARLSFQASPDDYIIPSNHQSFSLCSAQARLIVGDRAAKLKWSSSRRY